jgi:hypothetical protein
MYGRLCNICISLNCSYQDRPMRNETIISLTAAIENFKGAEFSALSSPCTHALEYRLRFLC